MGFEAYLSESLIGDDILDSHVCQCLGTTLQVGAVDKVELLVGEDLYCFGIEACGVYLQIGPSVVASLIVRMQGRMTKQGQSHSEPAIRKRSISVLSSVVPSTSPFMKPSFLAIVVAIR